MTEQKKQEIINVQKTKFVSRIKFYADDKGYKLGYVWVKVYDDGFESLQFSISKNDSYSYTPDFYESTSINFGKSFDNNPKFEVQTTSYGALNQEEMEKFIFAMEQAFLLQQFLHDLDWSECPRIKVDEK